MFDGYRAVWEMVEYTIASLVLSIEYLMTLITEQNEWHHLRKRNTSHSIKCEKTYSQEKINFTFENNHQIYSYAFWNQRPNGSSGYTKNLF